MLKNELNDLRTEPILNMQYHQALHRRLGKEDSMNR